MAKSTQTDRRPTGREDSRREGTDLHRRYGRIGISAVAAAAPYCSGARNPDHAVDMFMKEPERDEVKA